MSRPLPSQRDDRDVQDEAADRDFADALCRDDEEPAWLVACPACDLLRIDEGAGGDPRLIIIGAAFLGWSLGREVFVRALCTDHRAEYLPLLLRVGAALSAFGGP